METLSATEARNLSENSPELLKIIEIIKKTALEGKMQVVLSKGMGLGVIIGMEKLGYKINAQGNVISW